MRPRLASTCCVLLGSALLAICNLAGSAAHAQQRDDAWVIAQVMAGKFEELRALEKLSDAGVPFAMYWWGNLTLFCVFERCDTLAARELFLRAAKAGHGRAQAGVFAIAAKFPGDSAIVAELTAGVGVPKDGYARQVHAIQSVAPFRDPKARADFVTLATSERQLGLLAELVKLEGLSKREDELRAVADSGYVAASLPVVQLEVIRRTTHAQILERARAGELWLAAAYCDARLTLTGEQILILPPDTLPVCERAAARGFPGAVRALLAHHHHSKNQRTAEYFAGVCDALLGLGCADDIADHYFDRRDESSDLRAKWELWVLPGASEERLRGKTEGLRRALFTLVVRTALIAEACLMQRVDVATGTLESNPQCPWRRPIAIPAEFLSGTK